MEGSKRKLLDDKNLEDMHQDLADIITTTFFRKGLKSAAASISRRSRPSSASTGIRTVAQQRPVSAAGSLRSPAKSQQQESASFVNKKRTPHSKQSAPPVVDTPIVVIRKPVPGKKKGDPKTVDSSALEIGGIKKEIGGKSPRQTPTRNRPVPMRYKYDAPPGFNEAYGKGNRTKGGATPLRRIIKKEEESQHVGPSGADPSLSPYRGDYGSVVTEDAFGARPRSPVISPTGKKETRLLMENSIHCKMFLMTDSEKWMMMRLKVCGHPYQQNHSPEEEEVKPRRLGKKGSKKKKEARKRRVEKRRKVAAEQ